MTDSSYDEARRCFKCGELGEITSQVPYRGRARVARGTQIHSATCKNPRCKAFGTVIRTIQVNPDGTIPPPLTKRDKQFPAVPDLSAQVNEALAEQLRLEKQGGGEVSRR
jgi:hypothetical protein